MHLFICFCHPWKHLANSSSRRRFSSLVTVFLISGQDEKWVLSSHFSVRERAKSHLVLALGNTEGGHELWILVWPTTDRILCRCAVMVEKPWLVTPQFPGHPIISSDLWFPVGVEFFPNHWHRQSAIISDSSGDIVRFWCGRSCWLEVILHFLASILETFVPFKICVLAATFLL